MRGEHVLPGSDAFGESNWIEARFCSRDEGVVLIPILGMLVRQLPVFQRRPRR